MSLTLDENKANYQIRSYQPGQIQVNDQFYTKSIIVGPEKLIENWQPQSIDELKPEHFKLILEIHPAILIIGTGSQLQFPALEIYGELISKGIGVEIMDTRAACRTYTALASENRDVMVALIIRG